MKKPQEDEISRIEKVKLDQSDEALKEILKLVRDKNIAVKLTAIEALSLFPHFPEAKNTLLSLLDASNSEVRYYAVESLESFTGDDIDQAIIPRLKDSNELVRISSIEVIGNHKYKQAIPFLKQVLSDKSALVRGTAAEILGKLGNKDIAQILEDGLRKETRNSARLGFYLGLYWLGDKTYLDSILSMLKAKSYRVRSATANSLIDLADQENVTKIIESLNKALSKEKTIAVKSSISNALIELGEKLDSHN